MCGIAGWISYDGDLKAHQDVITTMTKTMARRGPDAGGVWIDRHAGLGHRRLAVIDLAGGLQIRRSLVMGAHRVELTGFSDGAVGQLKVLGLTSEIIAWHLRLFVPNAEDRGPAILGAVLDRHPLLATRARAAA